MNKKMIASYPAVLPTYTGWRWVCPVCRAWGRAATRKAADKAYTKHQQHCGGVV